MTLQELLELTERLIERDGSDAPVAVIILTTVDVTDISTAVNPAEVLETVSIDTHLEQVQLDTLKTVIDELDPL